MYLNKCQLYLKPCEYRIWTIVWRPIFQQDVCDTKHYFCLHYFCLHEE